MDEPIIDYLRSRLRAIGHASWPRVAEEAGCALSLLRKVAYGDRTNPGVETIQPLLTYLRAKERDEQAAE